MTNHDKVNKAIEEDDLLFLDKTLVRPISLDGDNLCYMELQELEHYIVDINDIDKVNMYEEGE